MANYVWTNEAADGDIYNAANYRVYSEPFPIAIVAPGPGDAVHVGQEYLTMVGRYDGMDASHRNGPQTVVFDLYIYQSGAPPVGSIFDAKVNYPSENAQPSGLVFNGILETVNDFMQDCTFNGPVIWMGPNLYNAFEGSAPTNVWNRYLQLGFGGPKLYSLNSPDIPRGSNGPAIGPYRINTGS